jgi:hypothetical protein
MVIVGVTALCAGQELNIWWFPVTRDTIVYIISIVMLYGVLIDGKVSMTESLILCISNSLLPLLLASNAAPTPWPSCSVLLVP